MGNMGSVIGPPVAKQLASLTDDKVTVQGVDYPADASVTLPHLHCSMRKGYSYANHGD